tara:strand:+ start:580 stop:831 length:252 start_codon:yes stop_codon:yes gene_type:complete
MSFHTIVMRAHDVNMTFMYDMHARVEKRDNLDIETCRIYLQMLAEPFLSERFYNPVIQGQQFTYVGNGCRIVRPSALRPLPTV